MKKPCLAFAFALCLLLPGLAASTELRVDFAKCTPLGSWRLVEATTVDADGNRSLKVVKTSFVDRETRGDAEFVWVELEIDSFLLDDKGKRTPEDDKLVMKILIPSSVFEGDLADVLTDITSFARELIVQEGNQDPVLINNVGIMAQTMLASSGMSMDYEFEPKGKEKVKVPAGTFDCNKLAGKASTRTTLVYKKVDIKSESLSWFSEEVPFALVKRTSEDSVDDETQRTELVLVKYKRSGAKSKIKKKPKVPDLLGY